MKPEDVSVWIDGARVAPADARVSVFDRAFLYGDSVFETMRSYGGHVYALEDHLERLEQSAKSVLIQLPSPRPGLAAEVRSAVAERRARGDTAEFYVRLMVSRGQGVLGLDPHNAGRPLRVLFVGPLEPPPSRFYDEGISVVSFLTARHGDVVRAPSAKTGNYLVAVLAADAARKAGAQEALFMDAEGHVSEGSTSNVFWCEGQTVFTPPLEAGILPGITRRGVIDAARRLGLPVQLRTPRLDELLAADEVFICSSIRELLPVVRIDGKSIAGAKPGPLGIRLHQTFRAQAERAALADFAAGQV